MRRVATGSPPAARFEQRRIAGQCLLGPRVDVQPDLWARVVVIAVTNDSDHDNAATSASAHPVSSAACPVESFSERHPLVACGVNRPEMSQKHIESRSSIQPQLEAKGLAIGCFVRSSVTAGHVGTSQAIRGAFDAGRPTFSSGMPGRMGASIYALDRRCTSAGI